MKGIVFTEFIEMVENRYGLELVDEIITSSELISEGIYTAVGTYDHNELFKMVKKLSQKIKVKVPDLLRGYGKELFKVFVLKYNSFFEGYNNTLDFLEGVDQHIHVEVRKLYPDAELPKLTCTRNDKDSLTLIYESSRKLSDFGEGLISGCAEYFNEEISIGKRNLSSGNGDKVEFKINVIR